LDNALGATVPAPVEGNLLTGSLLPTGGSGADGPAYVRSITIGGVTYSYNALTDVSSVTGGTSTGNFNEVTNTWTVTAPQGGQFVVDMDGGNYRYIVPPTVPFRQISEVMNFVITDRDGDTTGAALTVNVTNPGAQFPNEPPVVAAQSASVSEEGLAGGVPDTTGNPDTTNAVTVNGVMSATDNDGNPEDTVAGWAVEAPTQTVTSNGTAVVWTSAVAGGVQTLTGTAAGATVATLTMTQATGAYTFTLAKAIDHASATSEDALALNFRVTASDGRATGANTLTINVEDDSPTVVQATREATAVDTNLMVVLDISGSMNEFIPGSTTVTRLASAIASINTLLDRYDAAGDVRVRIVTFSQGADPVGDVWTTVAAARTQLGSITASGGTNYDAALGDAITAFDSTGKLTGAQNVSYFISDGVPTFGLGTTGTATDNLGTDTLTGTVLKGDGSPTSAAVADEGIQAAEETTWRTFLQNNKVDSFALGVEGIPEAQRAVLDPIAYNGRTNEERSGVVVTAARLDSVLSNTVPAQVSGNLLTGSLLSGGVGADAAAYVKTLTLDGVTYTYSPLGGGGVTPTGTTAVFESTGNTLTITSETGGKFIVVMQDPVTTDAVNTTGTYRYEVPPSVSAAGAVESLGFSVSDTDGDSSAQSTLTINVSKAGIINGTTAAETLNGTATPDVISGLDGTDVINGNAGDDRLSGGAGADTLSGGDGDDVVNGGIGADNLTGGLGSDVFQWSLADPAATGTARSIDTITDFNTAAASSGGDVLDLRDLLTGETTATLVNFLSFSVDTASATPKTTILVSPTGTTTDTHEIVLQGVDIRVGLGLPSTAADAQIITELLNKGKLLVDN
jgi:T1SS-143 domain-containing protein